MKKFLVSGVLALLGFTAVPSFGQRSCGNELMFKQLQRDNPEAYRALQERHQKMASEAQEAASTASKTTATYSPIPIVFHIVVSQTQYITLGRDTGIRRRVNSQLASLNRDFNKQNTDANLIPAAFRSLHANANMKFGLSNQTSSFTTFSPGIEIKIITGTAPAYDVNNGMRAAKDPAQGGLAAWDPSKFLNVWVVRTPSDILGLSVSPGLWHQQFGNRVIDETDYGVVLSMGAFGVREFQFQTFTPNIDMGRTLTHEIGHFFELRHIWGDDDFGTAAGYCPGDVVGGQYVGYDDGISDTPPQSKRTYCDINGTNCPSFPVLDKCSPNSPGIMFMNFMDYVDDRAMQMFTTGQVNMMRAQIAENSGASFNLTQSPGAISLSAATVSPEAFQLYPNPATSSVHISLAGSEQLQSVQLTNLTGQVIRSIQADGRREYQLQTGDLARGLYFVQCRFAEGVLSRKIVLQ